ncbi:protein kinase [Streptomyces sp. NPDC051173]|uniref:phthiocerol/phthiodiolone dimycocerosyl transferase family protein n=1 Tax=Streptomyces sp. NPDC051173 TaxID=3155164 RepID=UPI00344C15C5
MHRVLCPLETFYAAQRSRAVVSCTVRGDIDESLLAAAFAAQLARHPSLRSRIEPEGAGHALRPLSGPDVPELVVLPGGPDGLADELNAPFSAHGPLARAVLLRGGAEHTFVLTLDHTVCDGLSALALHDALWGAYSALATTGTAAPLPREDWPAAVTDRLPPCPDEEVQQHLARRIEHARRFPVTSLPYEAATGNHEPHRRRVEVRRLLLSSDATARLLRFSRATGVSMQGLVAAALLIAVRRRLGGGAGPRTLGCLSPVDLRSRLTPPLPRELMLPAVATYLDALEVTGDDDPVELGRRLGANLRSAVGRGDFLRELRIQQHVPRHPGLMTTSVVATNLGAHRTPPAPPGLSLTDLRVIPVRERYYPEAGRGPVMGCIASFDGRLRVEFPYSTECFTGEQIQEVRDAAHAILLSLTDRAAVARAYV